MNIREINAMRGPNFWSIRRHKLIVMVLDLEEMETRPTNTIEGFGKRLKELIPSLYSHHCSEGHEGGFFERVKDGTWMGHVIEHIALEIQTLAGMETGFGRTRGYGEEGVYNVVFSYVEEHAGRYAARASVRICEAIIAGESYDLQADIEEMRKLREQERLGPSTASIVEEAAKRGIPWIRLNEHMLCQLGYGEHQKRIQATVTSETSNIGVELACDKEDTKYLLEEAEVPVPRGYIVYDEEELEDVCNSIGYPLAIKPVDGNHGRGITVDITQYSTALEAFRSAKKISRRVIVERYIQGDDYRLLVINYKLVAAAKRSPAHVIGDGSSTIQELIDEVNKDPRRGYGHENVLTAITVDELTESLIASKGYTVNDVLPEDELLVLKDTANLSTGGTAEDVTDQVHPANIAMAERISKIIDLDICGIDVMTTDITKPLEKTKGAVLEVNAAPGFRMHLAPTKGKPRNVAAPVVDKLFPGKDDQGRIPIVAVTGTNGKTTTSRLIAHIAKMSGKRVGYTTSDGVYIQNHLLMKGDCTGPVSSEFVLKDPTVNFAVLECARGGLLRAGLGFSQCDVGIVTNVAEDHLGLKGINTVEKLAKLKAVIPETVNKNGYAILNADDDRVYNMREQINSKLALFSMNGDNERIKEHQEKGEMTAVYENGFITLYRGAARMRIIEASSVPLTHGGRAKFMIQNILPAVLAASVRGMTIEDMKAALQTFIPSASQAPGRLNRYRMRDFEVVLDYAHNLAGMKALKQFTDSFEASEKVGIVAAIGDRRDQDNISMGEMAARMFDKLIIRVDKHLRGQTEEQLIGLLKEGIEKGNPEAEPLVIPNEEEALNHALENAKKNSLVVLCCDDIDRTTEIVKEFKEKELAG